MMSRKVWVFVFAVGCASPVTDDASSADASVGVLSQGITERECTYGAHAGTPGSQIYVCAELNFNPQANAATYAYLLIGETATRATGCKVTTWSTLWEYQTTPKWNSPRTVYDCTWALRRGDELYIGSSYTGTTARYAYANACVDLYFDHSTHSGWQACARSDSW